ncbi:MAG: DUF3047 domain-containing protein [Candidatus Omnitrophota bacterium]
MKKNIAKVFLASAFFVCVCIVATPAIIYLRQFTFNEDKALAKWNKMILNGQVNYVLMKQGGNGFVEALSEKACSALYYRIGFKLKEYPVLSWKWKVLQFPDTSAAQSEDEKDDYAARVYVIFPFFSFSSSKFIEYVWSPDLPVGTVKTNPKAKNVKMIVARSGRSYGGEWVSESRNVYDDYIKVFGAKPNRNVGAVAIMSDADQTKTVAEAAFDDIAIERK